MVKPVPKANAAADFEVPARLFAVLSDPTRLAILFLLQQQPRHVSDIVQHSGLKQPNVSKHLAMMYDAGLLARQRDGNQIRYSIREPLVFELCDLVCCKLRKDAEFQVTRLRQMFGNERKRG
ncbi:MAG: metalloregulator ArsR/SmtB family transcription factor [Tepidisphaeraceae bacterium]|jgi:DNA-binding transcriptional ArsR family regulator